MNVKKIRLLYILIVINLIAVTLMSACVGDAGKEANAPESVKTEPRKFGATYMTMNNPYFDVLNESIKNVVEANGDYLITRDPSQSQEKQNDQIMDMIEEGVSGIFLNPVDWKEVKPALIACHEAGIPVFNVDTCVYDTQYVQSTIVSNNYNAGVQCAKDVMKKLDSADIVILDQPTTNSIYERIQGFMDTIQGHEEYRIVRKEAAGGELEVAMDVMDSILKENLYFDVVMGGNDPTALGALAAIQANHLDRKILIYGVDGSPDGKSMIKEGLLEGTSSQRPSVIGNVAAQTAYKYLNGERIQEHIVVPVSLVTSDNLDAFDIDGWE